MTFILRYTPAFDIHIWDGQSAFKLRRVAMSPKRKAGASKSKAKARPKNYRRIATEEAFAIPEQMEAQRELLANTQEYDPDLFLWKVQTDPNGPVHNRLIDLYEMRMQEMDKYDVDVHLLALTSTGVQMMEPDRAV